MHRFDEAYKTVLHSVGLSGTDADSTGYVGVSPMLMQNLIFEAVIQPDLDPIPKPILDYVCSKVKPKLRCSVKFAYEDLYDKMEKSGYSGSEVFEANLKELKAFKSGYLQIGVCTDSIEDFIAVFKSDEMSLERVMNFNYVCKNDVSGNTFSGDPLLMARFKNACIFLNVDHIKPYSTWKDTLSHELTHFVHRVVSFSNVTTFGKIERRNIEDPMTGLQFISTDIEVNDKFYSMYERLFNGTAMKMPALASLYKNTLYFREEKTTVQNILNGFQRMYEQQNLKNDKPSYKGIESGHDPVKYERQRLDWLDNLLSKIDSDYFRNEGRWVVDEFSESPHQRLTGPWKYQQQFKNAIVILQYVGVRELIPKYNIDERLKEHFKTFKFRDN